MASAAIHLATLSHVPLAAALLAKLGDPAVKCAHLKTPMNMSSCALVAKDSVQTPLLYVARRDYCE